MTCTSSRGKAPRCGGAWPAIALSAALVGSPAWAQQGPFLYVANQAPATVSIIDLSTHTLAETIDLQALGFSSNAKPHHTAVDPDGSYWYVSLIGDGRVLKFDRDNRLVGQAEFEAPGLLAVHPREDLLFVGRSMAAVNPPRRIGVIQRSSMDIEELDVFFPRPHAIAVDPRGGHVYTASLAVNQLASLDLETEVLELTSVDGEAHTFVQFAIAPDGRYLIVTGQMTGTVFVFDSSEPSNLTLVATLEVGAWPWHPVFTPDGRYVYLGNQAANTITVIDAEDWTVVEVIEGRGIAEPHGIAVSSDGRYVYVSSRNLEGAYVSPNSAEQAGTVVVIDVATRHIVRVIEVEPYAAGMSTQPAQP